MSGVKLFGVRVVSTGCEFQLQKFFLYFVLRLDMRTREHTKRPVGWVVAVKSRADRYLLDVRTAICVPVDLAPSSRASPTRGISETASSNMDVLGPQKLTRRRKDVRLFGQLESGFSCRKKSTNTGVCSGIPVG